MLWLDELLIKRRSRASHLFLLHLSVNDIFLREKSFAELREYLFLTSPCVEAQFTAYFNRADGIRFTNEEQEESFKKFLAALFPAIAPNGANRAVAEFEISREVVKYMFWLFSVMLEIGWEDQEERVHQALEKTFGQETVQQQRGRPFFNVIIDYAESIVPPEAISGELYDRDAIVTLLSWAKNSVVEKAHNTIVLVAEMLSAVAPQLASETNGIVPIKIPFLSFRERLETLETLCQESEVSDFGLSSDLAARLSAGLSRRNLTQLVRETIHRGEKLQAEQIVVRKKKHLEDRSLGMAELCSSLWGLEAIGALEDKKTYILEVVSAMQRGDVLSVPQGVLLLGGYGTGKIVFVQALAHEADLPLIRLKNIRSMWVGQSERHQEFILELLKNYAPVIIFVDEIDQEFLIRGSVFHGDTGVTARMQKRFLEVISDTDLRGYMLWIGASNRPELIDQAFIREGRFDDVLPFLPPSAEERSQILVAILNKFRCQAEHSGHDFAYEISKEFLEKFGWLTHGHFKIGEGWSLCTSDNHRLKGAETEVEFTGGEIEYIVIRAQRKARRQNRPLQEQDLEESVKDFIPKRDIIQFNQATDMALVHCNSLDAVPLKWRERMLKLRGVIRSTGPTLTGSYL